MSTPILALPEIVGSQANKYITHNEALAQIEAVLVRALSRTTAAQPSAPAEGDVYILPASPTGTDWVNYAQGDIAYYFSGAWHNFTPIAGLRLWVNDANALVIFDGTSWTAFQPAVADGSLTVSKLSDFDEDASATSGLTWGYQAARVRNGNTITDVAAGTVSLTASATNYVEVDGAGAVSVNTSGFTIGRLPLRTIVTGSSTITTSTDRRAWLSMGGAARKDNSSATTDPTASDDSTAGYSVGSLWYNTSTDNVWRCLDATVGAAVWKDTTLSLSDLGSAATANTGTGPGDVPTTSEADARYLQSASDLSDLGNAQTARTNLGLGTFATADYKKAPFVNRLSDSGRFDGGSYGVRTTNASATFTNNLFFGQYNSATVASAGQFIYNNTDFGGSAGNMTQTVVDLLNTMGRTGSAARYGGEFFVPEFTAGSGTTASATFGTATRYLVTTNPRYLFFGADGYATIAFWLRAIGGNCGIGGTNNNAIIYINGSLAASAANYDLTPAQGWVHVRKILSNPNGYSNAEPMLYSNSGNGFQLALPAVFTGFVDCGVHTSPLLASSLTLG